ncbi:MAG: ABC transporter substrate-binding protein [Oligoflexales bacterium]|nr:ABC transporter substrate-binding protein [Oligoflexales bacterium]
MIKIIKNCISAFAAYFSANFIIPSSDHLALATENSSINIAWEAAPRTFDPRFALDANSQYIEELLHCSLLGFDASGQIRLDLAKELTWLNPLELKITIRDDKRFADNQIVSITDVITTYQQFINGTSTKSPRAGAFRNLKEIRQTNLNEALFVLFKPDAAFMQNLSIGILSSKVASQENIDFLSYKGCGPLTLKTHSPSQITLEKNTSHEDYDVKNKSNIIIKFVKDETTTFAKLKKGEIDLVQSGISRDKLAIIAKDPQFKILRAPGLSTTYLGFNMKDSILSKKSVRQAIGYAIDRPKIMRYVLHDLAILSQSILTPGDKYFSAPNNPLEYAPQKAEKLLDEAGLVKQKNGYRFKLTYSTTANATRIILAKAIAADLKKIGIEVVVKPLEWSRFKQNVDAGTVQLWSLSWVGFKDPDILRYAFASESFPPAGANRGFFSNKFLDELLQKGVATPEYVERKNIYKQAQDLIYEELPYVFLWHEDVVAVTNSKIYDYNVYADGRYRSLMTAKKRD